MDGILLLNKPKGLTSHDCVFKIRKILHTKKVGHTGTLDPDVSGVLPICIGRATKIVEYITAASKVYEGEVTLGFSTTTEDKSGEIVEQVVVNKPITREEIIKVLDSLTGDIEQTPPMYSAIKVNGKRLYEYARKGIEVERPTRNITIHELVLLGDENEFDGKTISFRFRVSCSKGTYVRTLAVMIGERLGYPAHMSDLIRVRSGAFTLEECLSLEEVEQLANNLEINQHLHTINDALSHLPNYIINDKVTEKVKNGAVLNTPDQLLDLSPGEQFLIMDDMGKVLAIYEIHPTKSGLIKPVKVLVNNQELS